MKNTMDHDKIKALAAELAKDLKTPADLNALSAQLTKITVEAALNAEMQEHLSYAPYEAKGRANTNSRNGYTTKTLKGDHGEIEIATPRDREATFEPELVRKGQTRITGMDEQLHCLYAKGMSTRDIVDTFQEMYGAEVSNAVMEQVVDWQRKSSNQHWGKSELIGQLTLKHL